MRSARWLLMPPLAEQWGFPSSPLLLSHLGAGVIWLRRPSAVLDAFWARDLASPPLSPLASSSKGALCRCGEGMLPCGCTVSLPSPPSLTVLFDFHCYYYLFIIYKYIFFCFCFLFCFVCFCFVFFFLSVIHPVQKYI